MASYTKGAADGAKDAFSLYPRDFVQEKIAAGEDSVTDYAEKNYFANLKH